MTSSPFLQPDFLALESVNEIVKTNSGASALPSPVTDLISPLYHACNPLSFIRRQSIPQAKKQTIPLKISPSTQILLVCSDPGDNIPSSHPHHISMGPRRIASFLNHRGVESAIADFCIHERDACFDAIRLYRPPLIAFSILYDTIENDINNLWRARELCPESLIVAGGIEATNNSDVYIRKLPVDIIVMGEGEIPLLQIAKVIKRGAASRRELLASCEAIPGLRIKHGRNEIISSGQARLLSPREYREAFRATELYLDEYEAYWWQSEVAGVGDPTHGMLVRRVVRIPTANYCPGGCSFCAGTRFLNRASGRKDIPLIQIPPAMMVEKVKQILFRDPDLSIYLEEENALIDKGRMRNFCRLVLKEGITTRFLCKSRVDRIDEETVQLMAQAGFVNIGVGIESFDKVALDDLNKHINLEKAEEAIDIIRLHGISCSVNLIIFPPRITPRGLAFTLRKGIEYIRRGVRVGFYYFVIPYPGTRYHRNSIYRLLETKIIVPGTGETLRHPFAVLPQDERLAPLALTTLKNVRSVIDEWKKKFSFNLMVQTDELLFLAVAYIVLGKLDGLDEHTERDIVALARRFGRKKEAP